MITRGLAQSEPSTIVSCYYYYFANEKTEARLKVAHQVSSNAGIDSKAHVLCTVRSFGQ